MKVKRVNRTPTRGDQLHRLAAQCALLPGYMRVDVKYEANDVTSKDEPLASHSVPYRARSAAPGPTGGDSSNRKICTWPALFPAIM